MPARQQGNFCSFGVVNLDRQPVVKIIRQRGVNLVRQEVIFYASFSSLQTGAGRTVENHSYPLVVSNETLIIAAGISFP